MTLPTYSLGVINNYRAMFREKYGHDCKITNNEIWFIYNTVFNDISVKLEDAERIEAMYRLEKMMD